MTGESIEELLKQSVAAGEISADDALVILQAMQTEDTTDLDPRLLESVPEPEPEQSLQESAALSSAEMSPTTVPPSSLPPSAPAAAVVETPETDIRSQLLTMTMPQKIKTAMFGNSVARGLLITNPNKLIQEFVLKNPKITAPEIEAFLKSTTVSAHVLRIISQSREWMKNYSNKVALVRNPKTPQDISLKWLRYLNSAELKELARSKNVPNVIRTTATRMITATEKKGGH